ncbi:hypothetical protein GOP47_0023081, partial [Adiantum capillus-veneris]
ATPRGLTRGQGFDYGSYANEVKSTLSMNVHPNDRTMTTPMRSFNIGSSRGGSKKWPVSSADDMAMHIAGHAGAPLAHIQFAPHFTWGGVDLPSQPHADALGQSWLQ